MYKSNKLFIVGGCYLNNLGVAVHHVDEKTYRLVVVRSGGRVYKKNNLQATFSIEEFDTFLDDLTGVQRLYKMLRYFGLMRSDDD